MDLWQSTNWKLDFLEWREMQLNCFSPHKNPQMCIIWHKKHPIIEQHSDISYDKM